MKFPAATLQQRGTLLELEWATLMSEEETHTVQFKKAGAPPEHLHFTNPRFKFHADGVTMSGYASPKPHATTATRYVFFLWKSKNHPEP